MQKTLAKLGYVILVSLVLFTGYLITKNQELRRENRRLVIENDSILSVNTELNGALHRQKFGDIKKASYRLGER